MVKVNRKTKETDINAELNIYGSGINEISTGIGFLNHMLTALTVHGGFDLKLTCKGDLEVDGHHTAEDIGIVLGKAFNESLGDKKGIKRYGNAQIPMDEALGICALDISGRPFLVFEAEFTDEKVGELETCLVEEFMRAFAFNAGITIHIKCVYGSNDHHKIEAMFKALAHSLRKAVKPLGNGEALSTKGVLV